MAIQTSRKDGRPLGRILLDEGHLTEEQHSALLSLQREKMKAVDPLVMKRKEAVLFGRLAIREGLVSEAETNECLRIQASEGEMRSLGELMIARGCLTTQQVKDLLAKQQKKIMVCPACRLSFTVLSISQDKKVECPRCKGPLEVSQATDTTRTDAQFAIQVLRAAKQEVPRGSYAESRVILPTAVKVKVACIICETRFQGPVDSTGRVRCPSCQTLFLPARSRKRE